MVPRQTLAQFEDIRGLMHEFNSHYTFRTIHLQINHIYSTYPSQLYLPAIPLSELRLLNHLKPVQNSIPFSFTAFKQHTPSPSS
jgi:hypothetical protein